MEQASRPRAAPEASAEGSVLLWPEATGPRPAAFALAILFVAYLLGGAMAQVLAVIPGSGISLWPPGGVLLAALLLTRNGHGRIAVLVVALAADLLGNALWFQNSLSVALSLFAANAAGALASALLLDRAGGVLPFNNITRLLRLAVLGAGVGQIVSATIGSLVLEGFAIQPFLSAWPLWWLGDATGVMIFAPLVLTLALPDHSWPALSRLREALILSIVLAVVSCLYLTGRVPFVYIAAPPILWAAVRLHFLGATLGLLEFLLLIVAASLLDLRELPTDPVWRTRVAVEVQLFLAVSALTGLALAASTAEMTRAFQRLNRANEALKALSRERGATIEDSARRLQTATGAARLAWMEFPLSVTPTTALDVSNSFRALFGLGSAAPVTPRSLLQTVAPVDRGRLRRAFAGLMSRTQDFDIEYRLCSDVPGQERWMRSIAMADTAPTAGAGRMISTVTFDITDRKRAEIELAASRKALDMHLAELEILYAQAPFGVAMLDTNLHFRRINTALAEMNGYSPEAHLGKSAWDLVPKLRPVVEPHLLHVVESGQPILDLPVKGETAAQPGVMREWREQIYPLHRNDGSIFGIGIICEEVTERAAMAEQLRAREELYHGIFLLAGTGIALIGLNAEIQSGNPALAALIGQNPAEAEGRPLGDLIHPEDRATFEAWCAALLSGHSPVPTIDLRLPGPRGDVRHVQAQGALLHDVAGKPLRAMVLFTDVTEARLAASRKEVLVRELGHRAKNLMAIVQAIANRTFVAEADPDTARRAFSGRISALARSLDTISGGMLTHVRLDEIARSQLSAFGRRVYMHGPDLTLPPRNAQMCALILHELATNAVKYGALSVPEGHVRLVWSIEGDRFHLHWQEHGGPPPNPPRRQGFGTMLITLIAGESLNCSPILSYEATGFEYRIDAPLDAVTGPETPETA